jgi:hypothetical protein
MHKSTKDVLVLVRTGMLLWNRNYKQLYHLESNDKIMITGTD